MQNNEAMYEGGGIYNDAILYVISQSLVYTNTAERGAGIFNNRTTWVDNSALISNSAILAGGGIFSQYNLTVTHSLLDSNSADAGGGIANIGTAWLDWSTLSHNRAVANDGGGIANTQGKLTLLHSTLNNNSAFNGAGGGLWNMSAEATITNSTFSANEAAAGGGIYNDTMGNVDSIVNLAYVTIMNNTAGVGGGIDNETIEVGTALVNITSSIIGENDALDCFDGGTGVYVSHDYNLDSDGSCHLLGSNDRPNTPPQLGPFADNGGPTWTHLPLALSPVIDWIPIGANGCGTVIVHDQRSMGRPIEDYCDIGAVEVALNYPPVPADDFYTIVEDDMLIVPPPGVLGNDEDGDNDPLIAALDTPPTNGLATVAATGAFTYTPAANFNGTDAFTYIAFDGALAATATVYITITPVCDYALTLDPPTSVLSGDPGAEVTHPLTLTNMGDCSDTFAITLSGNLWPSVAPLTIGPLAPGVHANLPVTVSVPEGAFCDDWDTVVVDATSQSLSSTADESILTTEANAIYALNLTPSNAATSGDPGTIVTYTLRVTNTGNCVDTFDVDVSGNLWPTNAPPIAGPLEAGDSVPINVTVTVPLDALCQDSDLVTITLTSQNSSATRDSSDLTTWANTVRGVAIAPPSDATFGAPGSSVVYALEVTNAGNCIDSLDITITGNIWPATPESNTVGPLAPGTGAPISVTVDIPSGANDGDFDVAIVTCSSQGGNLASLAYLKKYVTESGAGIAKSFAPATRNSLDRAETGIEVLTASSRLTTTAIVDCEPVFDTTFTWTPIAPSAGQVFTLTASIGGGSEPISYTWELGDGTSDSGMTITHVYGTAGTYTVTLTTENLCGADQDRQWIEVEELPPSHHLIYLPVVTRNYAADLCGEALKNRDFERGHAFWIEESAGRPHLISNAWPDPYQGSWVAWLGGYDNAQDLLSQRIYVPAEVQNEQHLTFYLAVDSNDDPLTPYDLLVVRFVDDWGNPLSNDIPIADNTTPMGWTRQSIDLVGFSGIGGMHVWLQFEATSNISLSTNFVIDLISMDFACHPPPHSGR